MSSNLPKTIATTLSLLSHFETTLATPPDGPTTSSSSPDPLILLKAAAMTGKSYVTKLSLLLITAPFTPSAITTVLNELNTAVLPSLVTAALLCAPEKFTQGFYKDGVARSSRLLKTLSDLAKIGDRVARTGRAAEGQREKEEVTSVTGRIWEACDDVVALAEGGVVGFVVRKAEEWRALVKDAIEELDEWDPEDGDSDDIFGEADGEDDSNGKEGDTEAAQKLAEKKNATVKLLKAVEKVYPALSRRRLKTYPADASIRSVTSMEDVMVQLKGIPDTVDELAETFYSRDEEGITSCLLNLKGISVKCGDHKQNWNGEEDEFTTWSGKWLAVVQKLADDITSGPAEQELKT